MSRDKQSSVEWLINRLEFYYGESIISVMEQEIEQAKGIHKEEIKEAYNQGDIQLVNGEQYYAETFGGNNEQG